MSNARPKRAREVSFLFCSDRRAPAAAPGAHRLALRAGVVVGIALGAAQLGACVRYDSMRVFYGRDSVVLRPEGSDAAPPATAIATVPENGD